MNKFKILAAVVFAVITVGTTQSQSVVKKDATIEDYIKLLKFSGYEVFSHDFTFPIDGMYGFMPLIMKYENGKVENFTQEIEDWGFCLVDDNPTDSIRNYSISTQTLNDSTVKCYCRFGEIGYDREISFKKISDKNSGYYDYFFVRKPFKMPNELKLNEFVPLVAISSGWYDAEIESVRNCDVNEFDSDYLNTATFKYSPLIYVIGVKCLKIQ